MWAFHCYVHKDARQTFYDAMYESIFNQELLMPHSMDGFYSSKMTDIPFKRYTRAVYHGYSPLPANRDSLTPVESNDMDGNRCYVSRAPMFTKQDHDGTIHEGSNQYLKEVFIEKIQQNISKDDEEDPNRNDPVFQTISHQNGERHNQYFLLTASNTEKNENQPSIQNRPKSLDSHKDIDQQNDIQSYVDTDLKSKYQAEADPKQNKIQDLTDTGEECQSLIAAKPTTRRDGIEIDNVKMTNEIDHSDCSDISAVKTPEKTTKKIQESFQMEENEGKDPLSNNTNKEINAKDSAKNKTNTNTAKRVAANGRKTPFKGSQGHRKVSNEEPILKNPKHQGNQDVKLQRKKEYTSKTVVPVQNATSKYKIPNKLIDSKSKKGRQDSVQSTDTLTTPLNKRTTGEKAEGKKENLKVKWHKIYEKIIQIEEEKTLQDKPRENTVHKLPLKRQNGTGKTQGENKPRNLSLNAGKKVNIKAFDREIQRKQEHLSNREKKRTFNKNYKSLNLEKSQDNNAKQSTPAVGISKNNNEKKTLASKIALTSSQKHLQSKLENSDRQAVYPVNDLENTDNGTEHDREEGNLLEKPSHVLEGSERENYRKEVVHAHPSSSSLLLEEITQNDDILLQNEDREESVRDCPEVESEESERESYRKDTVHAHASSSSLLLEEITQNDDTQLQNGDREEIVQGYLEVESEENERENYRKDVVQAHESSSSLLLEEITQNDDTSILLQNEDRKESVRDSLEVDTHNYGSKNINTNDSSQGSALENTFESSLKVNEIQNLEMKDKGKEVLLNVQDDIKSEQQHQSNSFIQPAKEINLLEANVNHDIKLTPHENETCVLPKSQEISKVDAKQYLTILNSLKQINKTEQIDENKPKSKGMKKLSSVSGSSILQEEEEDSMTQKSKMVKKLPHVPVNLESKMMMERHKKGTGIDRSQNRLSNKNENKLKSKANVENTANGGRLAKQANEILKARIRTYSDASHYKKKSTSAGNVMPSKVVQNKDHPPSHNEMLLYIKNKLIKKGESIGSNNLLDKKNPSIHDNKNRSINGVQSANADQNYSNGVEKSIGNHFKKSAVNDETGIPIREKEIVNCAHEVMDGENFNSNSPSNPNELATISVIAETSNLKNLNSTLAASEDQPGIMNTLSNNDGQDQDNLHRNFAKEDSTKVVNNLVQTMDKSEQLIALINSDISTLEDTRNRPVKHNSCVADVRDADSNIAISPVDRNIPIIPLDSKSNKLESTPKADLLPKFLDSIKLTTEQLPSYQGIHHGEYRLEQENQKQVPMTSFHKKDLSEKSSCDSYSNGTELSKELIQSAPADPASAETKSHMPSTNNWIENLRNANIADLPTLRSENLEKCVPSASKHTCTELNYDRNLASPTIISNDAAEIMNGSEPNKDVNQVRWEQKSLTDHDEGKEEQFLGQDKERSDGVELVRHQIDRDLQSKQEFTLSASPANSTKFIRNIPSTIPNTSANRIAYQTMISGEGINVDDFKDDYQPCPLGSCIDNSSIENTSVHDDVVYEVQGINESAKSVVQISREISSNANITHSSLESDILQHSEASNDIDRNQYLQPIHMVDKIDDEIRNKALGKSQSQTSEGSNTVGINDRQEDTNYGQKGVNTNNFIKISQIQNENSNQEVGDTRVQEEKESNIKAEIRIENTIKVQIDDRRDGSIGNEINPNINLRDQKPSNQKFQKAKEAENNKPLHISSNLAVDDASKNNPVSNVAEDSENNDIENVDINVELMNEASNKVGEQKLPTNIGPNAKTMKKEGNLDFGMDLKLESYVQDMKIKKESAIASAKKAVKSSYIDQKQNQLEREKIENVHANPHQVHKETETIFPSTADIRVSSLMKGEKQNGNDEMVSTAALLLPQCNNQDSCTEQPKESNHDSEIKLIEREKYSKEVNDDNMLIKHSSYKDTINTDMLKEDFSSVDITQNKQDRCQNDTSTNANDLESESIGQGFRDEEEEEVSTSVENTKKKHRSHRHGHSKRKDGKKHRKKHRKEKTSNSHHHKGSLLESIIEEDEDVAIEPETRKSTDFYVEPDHEVAKLIGKLICNEEIDEDSDVEQDIESIIYDDEIFYPLINALVSKYESIVENKLSDFSSNDQELIEGQFQSFQEILATADKCWSAYHAGNDFEVLENIRRLKSTLIELIDENYIHQDGLSIISNTIGKSRVPKNCIIL
ncbi:uncharacterized protein TRIADDRAFT_51309 [Trichoplax adhaerens]|uniref:Uncharacterized protein n=1 Tax=Trichoplax adhaerens TaxID=10228 RepID=B3RIG3_TRIAD|nr:hypothetical protein TRIADDRAFT_51309 [Trichoplax adhaerens]EDV28415.1 hypothetical protein TRIADDRAFT_51309 [Trichoplax adhaerens]|eukprot:XP_002107617.1 hypothetical protein TRIADDRAFT_51309 [Trichoplax adhaerens]